MISPWSPPDGAGTMGCLNRAGHSNQTHGNLVRWQTPEPLVAHSECAQIEIEHRFLFLAVGAIEFPQTHDLTHDLGVEAASLCFRINFADVGRECGLFFLESFDALDERLEMFLREA